VDFDQRPNIVLILADDLGYGDLGCYGGTDWATPRIDAFAASACRCTDFHSNGVVCSPTRAALLTGAYQQRCGIEGVVSAAHHREVGLAPGTPTLATRLRALGYRTALFGKWHLGYTPRYSPVHHGFETFRGFVSGNVDYHSHVDQAGHADWWRDDGLEPESGYTTELIAARSESFIAAHAAEPFCLVLPHAAPHYPYQGPDDPPERAVGGDVPTHGRRAADPVEHHRAYGEVMAAFDAAVGRTLDALDAAGVAERTIVVLSSDHGPVPPGSTGGLRGGKGGLYEGGHRVPSLIRWPGVTAAASTCDATLMGMDLLPGLVAAGGGTVDGVIDGCDPRPALAGGALAERDLHWRFRGQAALRRGPWKWLRPSAAAAPVRLPPPPVG